MSDTENKIDSIFGLVHEMKPMLFDVREGQKAMETRMRATEARGEQHEVKINRIQTDIDGLGQKVRSYPVSDAEMRGEPRGGKWLAFLEFAAVIPQYWHVGFGVLGLIAGAIGLTWRHHP